MRADKTICILCENESGIFFYQDKKRTYYRCGCCDLIFVPPQFHASSTEEKIQYDYHMNNPDDEGYRKFLGRLIPPLKQYVAQGMEGLDFGSGPGPTLHLLLQEEGFHMQIYDPFYANKPELLHREYDFITSTEVVEHFCAPKKSWGVLTKLVKNEGHLAIMTLRHDGYIPHSSTDCDHVRYNENFSGWWYKNDVTHVAFYSLKTFQWIENYFHLQLRYYDERVALFVKK